MKKKNKKKKLKKDAIAGTALLSVILIGVNDILAKRVRKFLIYFI